MCVFFFGGGGGGGGDSFTLSSRSTVIISDIQFTLCEKACSPILRIANPNGSDRR